MIPKAISLCDPSEDTLFLNGVIPSYRYWSTHPDRQVVTRLEMRGAATLCLNYAIRNWLRCLCILSSLHIVPDCIEDEGPPD